MSSSIHIGGVFPHLGVRAGLNAQRTEIGIGALMPWAERLWFVCYPSDGKGAGHGLFWISDKMRVRRHPLSVVGTYANRMIHWQSSQLIIGPYFIDTKGHVRVAHAMKGHRLTACMEHLTDAENLVYFLTMAGLMYEVNVHSLEAKLLFDLNRDLEIQLPQPEVPNLLQKVQIPHFKGGHTGQGRVVVANNTYDEADHAGDTSHGGRLAEWDGSKWTILERKAFNEVTGRRNWGQPIFATGWDKASAILRVLVDGHWQTYRLPKASHTWEHYWQTEWPRIREVESERYLMDCNGMFYEFSPVAFDNKIWGVRPISTHLRIIPDFCSWQGLLVLGGDQTTPISDNNLLAGQPSAGLWFGKTDDLWNFGKPAGWGGPWWDSPVKANLGSDPFLMTGFDKKCLHLFHSASQSVRFRVDVDCLGNQSWQKYQDFDVPAASYVHYEFPLGFSVHWVRVTSDADCKATAYFTYT